MRRNHPGQENENRSPARRYAWIFSVVLHVILLVVIGVLLVTGRFATVSASLADLGQWIDLEL